MNRRVITTKQIIDSMTGHLEYERDLGIDSVRCVDDAGKLEERQEISMTSDRKKVENCTLCHLCEERTNAVFGEGNENADIMFVGEGPGRDEDLQGRPFIGRAGQLLTKIIEAMGRKRSDVYIANIVKCRPPQNRNPLPDEIKQCYPYLLRQIEAIKPRVICTLGKFASQTLLNTEITISSLRGKFHDFNGINLMPTFHPAFLLRNMSSKKEVWEDMQKVMAYLDNSS